MAARGLEPSAALLNDFHGVVIHLVEQIALENVGGDCGTAVPVRRSHGVWGKVDAQTDNCFSRTVAEFVRVDDADVRYWAARISW